MVVGFVDGGDGNHALGEGTRRTKAQTSRSALADLDTDEALVAMLAGELAAAEMILALIERCCHLASASFCATRPSDQKVLSCWSSLSKVLIYLCHRYPCRVRFLSPLQVCKIYWVYLNDVDLYVDGIDLVLNAVDSVDWKIYLDHVGERFGCHAVEEDPACSAVDLFDWKIYLDHVGERFGCHAVEEDPACSAVDLFDWKIYLDHAGECFGYLVVENDAACSAVRFLKIYHLFFSDRAVPGPPKNPRGRHMTPCALLSSLLPSQLEVLVVVVWQTAHPT